MRRVLLVVAGCAALVAASNPLWALSDVVVSAKETTRPNTFALHVSAVVNTSALAARQVLLRQCQDKNLSGSLRNCQIFKKEGARSWSYSVSKYPIMDPRDVVLERELVSDLTPDGKGVFYFKWHLVSLPGMGLRKDHIRPGVYHGHWSVEPVDETHCRVSYESELEPGGSVPMFVFRYATRHGIPKTVERLEEAAKKAQADGVTMAPNAEDPWTGLTIVPMEASVLAEMQK